MGDDSNEAQAVGFTKKSERAKPTRKKAAAAVKQPLLELAGEDACATISAIGGGLARKFHQGDDLDLCGG